MTMDCGHGKLCSGTTETSGSKLTGASLGVVRAVTTADPAGLIIDTGLKVYGEESDGCTIEGRAKDMVKEIADKPPSKIQVIGLDLIG